MPSADVLRDAGDVPPLEILMQQIGELVVLERVGQERERQLRGTGPAVAPLESIRRMIDEIEPHRQRAKTVRQDDDVRNTVIVAPAVIAFHE